MVALNISSDGASFFAINLDGREYHLSRSPMGGDWLLTKPNGDAAIGGSPYFAGTKKDWPQVLGAAISALAKPEGE